MACDGFDVRSEAPIPLGHDYYNDTPSNGLKEIYLKSLLKTYLRLGFSTPEAMACDGFDVRSETPIPLGHDYYNDTRSDDLKVSNDPLSPLAIASSLEFSMINDHSEGSMIVHD